MPEANGTYDPGRASAEMVELISPKSRPRGVVDKRNHLSLVQGHLLQLSYIPRACWEPLGTLLTEYYQYRYWGLTDEQIKACEEQGDGEFLAFVKNWVNLLFTTSQSVDGRQSDLMVKGMGADREWQPRQAASQVGGNSSTGQPEAKGQDRKWGWGK